MSENSFNVEHIISSVADAQECLRIANILKGQNENIQTEKDEIVARVQEASKFIASQPAMLNFLKHLQTSLHQKNIGVFNQLLTYFVQDVLKKDKEISLDLYTYRNLPALKILAKNQGFPENIFKGNGGSVANIVSAGLRLIALSRLNHRKFIIMDEPDCWLEIAHVPLFAKTIGEIATKLKIQTILISHHPWEYFKDYARVIKLEPEGKMLTTDIILDHDWNISPDLNYVSQIRLQNVMSHTDTIYNLCPYLNCIIGGNDIGKSVLPSAVKAVAYNDSDDSFISHSATKANTLISISDGTQILWERIRETTPDFPQKVKFSLYKNGALIASEYNSDAVPEMINKELNISTVEDIDVHIGNQKEPVFLLGDSIKPQEKAKILSLGKESILIQRMMELLKAKTKLKNSIVKDGELKYEIINKKMAILDGLDEVIEQIEAIKKKMESQVEKVRRKDELKKEIQNLIDIKKLAGLEKLSTQVSIAERRNIEELNKDLETLENLQSISLLKKLNTNIEVSEYKDTNSLNNSIFELRILNKLRQLSVCQLPKNINVEMRKTDELEKDISNLSILKKMSSLKKVDSTVVIPDVKNLSKLKEDISRLSELKSDISKYKDLALKGKEMEKKIKQDMENFLKENGGNIGVCKECNQPLNFTHLELKHD